MATATIAVPVIGYLHFRDERDEPVDDAEVAAARLRHPSRSARAA